MATAELIDRETELKERVIRQLDGVHDIVLLNQISLLLDEDTVQSGKVHHLAPRVRQSIERALQQVKDGQMIPGETVFREIDEWLGTDD